MSDRIILELGGSVITEKGADCTVSRAALAGIAAAIPGAHAVQIVVVHGDGSCGHPEARRYHLDKGAADRADGRDLRYPPCCQCLKRGCRQHPAGTGVPALGIHPLHEGVAANGRLVAFESRHLEQMLALGMVPVIHGDVVMDLSRGACIVSGDRLVRYLAVALKCTRVGLATDVRECWMGDASSRRSIRRQRIPSRSATRHTPMLPVE